MLQIKKVWWLLPYDREDGKHFNLEWQSTINSRNRGAGCPFLGKNQHSLLIGFNDLASINPKLASQWHPTENGDLKPTEVTSCSEQKVWWLLPYDNPITGKCFNFEWQSTVANRSYGGNCSFLNSSRMELFLYDLLKHKNFIFKAEKTFKNCKDKNLLLFDIYLKNENIIIECDGLQHFENVKHFGG